MMQKHEIISRAAKYIGRIRNEFRWHNLDACVVAILARIAIGDSHCARNGKRMLTKRELQPLTNSMIRKYDTLLAEESILASCSTCPTWEQMIDLEIEGRKSPCGFDWPQVPLKALLEHGFSLTELQKAESTLAPKRDFFVSYLQNSAYRNYRKHVAKKLREWAAIEKAASMELPAFQADRTKAVNSLSQDIVEELHKLGV